MGKEKEMAKGLNRREALKVFSASATMLAFPHISFAKASDGFLEIITRPAKKEFDPETPASSELWTYNGNTPGPEIRIKRGERVKVRLINQLKEPTTIHWHGIRIDNKMDGVPDLTQRRVNEGETFEYDFIAPDAGTYWYHAHFQSWKQVARGLYGPLIIDEDTPLFDKDHDITLMMDDWRLDKEGKLDLNSLGALRDWSHAGRLGNWLTINGQSRPDFTLKTGEAYRLRLINASNARILRLNPNLPGAKIIAYDGQSLKQPQTELLSPLEIAPAQRVDLAITPTEQGTINLEEISSEEPLSFAQFTVSGNEQKPASLPVLTENSLPTPDLTSAKNLTLDMTGGAMGMMGKDGKMLEMVHKGKKLSREDIRKTKQVWAFNGVANLAKDPYFQADRNETITINVKNNTAFSHAIHMHGHHFQIIEHSAKKLEGENPWRDTFLIKRNETVKIAFVADNPGKWLLHCHMLEHAAAGMSTWFKVN